MSWDQIIAIVDSPQISVGSAVFKLIFSFIAGGLVGMNREHHKQPAGFRTHILICLGSTLLMMLSIYIPQTYFGFKNGDPGRIAAQVVSGIGFLGAGAIIRLGSNVRGITTAASIWLISAVGLTIGAGLYSISLLTIVLALFALIALERIEHRFFPQAHLKTLNLNFNSINYPWEDVKDILKKSKITISDYSIDIHNNSVKFTEISIIILIPETVNLTNVISQINEIPDVTSLKIS